VPSAKVSDDPEELLERADALFDSEDKLRREERALEARIGELRSEQDIDRRMSDFLGEGTLFDEADRRIVRPAAPRVGAPEPQPGAALPVGGATYKPVVNSGPMQPAAVVGNPGTMDAASKVAFEANADVSISGGGSQGPHGFASPGIGRTDGLTPLAPFAADLQPERPASVSRAPLERRTEAAAYTREETLEELTARRENLRSIADDLHRKAEETARRAKDLQ